MQKKGAPMKDTPQLNLWAGEFGYEYSKRAGNSLRGIDIARLRRNWGLMLSRAVSPEPASVLEIGANIGRNLLALKGMIPLIEAVEPNEKCCNEMRLNPMLEGMTLHNGSAFSLPHSDSSVDLVFTSGVLIHIDPDDLLAATSEIVRVARHYVLCIEYFSRQAVSVPYRDVGDGFLFKRDFGGWYLDNFSALSVVDYGFLWSRVDSGDDLNWWLFRKES